MSRPRTKNKHLPKYVTVIHGSYWYRPPKAKPQRLAAVGEESEMYRKMAGLVLRFRQTAHGWSGDVIEGGDKIPPMDAPRLMREAGDAYRQALKRRD